MSAQDIRICYIGDSFVNGTGDETCLGWAARVSARAISVERSVTCYNLGIRRNTSADILQRWEQECTPRLPENCDGRVVLSCGANDMVIENGQLRVSAAVSCHNVQQILQQASQKFPVILVGPPPVGDDGLNSRIQKLSSAYAQVAAAVGVPFIEVFSHLVSDRQYLLESQANDGYHPGSYGYIAISNIVAASKNWWFK